MKGRYLKGFYLRYLASHLVLIALDCRRPGTSMNFFSALKILTNFILALRKMHNAAIHITTTVSSTIVFLEIKVER